MSGGEDDRALRLDRALVERGLSRSRTNAARQIEAGAVRVNGSVVTKPAHPIRSVDDVRVEANDHYVSRAAHKLVAALDAFGVSPAGRACLDVGASTGGFTQVLLERGAAHVVAIDVGHGQLAPSIEGDARVTSIEGCNARDLNRESLDAQLQARRRAKHASRANSGNLGSADTPPPPSAAEVDLVVADLSFISLAHVLAPMRETVAEGADFVLLIKPQFEVGRQGVRGGIVVDDRLMESAVEGVLTAARAVGLATLGLIASPIEGTHGNREFVAHFAREGGHQTEWTPVIRQLTKGVRA